MFKDTYNSAHSVNLNPTSPEEQYELGNIFYVGSDVVKKDFERAVEWYNKAAQQGHADAQNKLLCIAQVGDANALRQQSNTMCNDVSGRLREVRQLTHRLTIAKLGNDDSLEETLDSVGISLLNAKILSDNGLIFLRLVTLIFDLAKMVSDSYTFMYVKRTILPALYFSESLIVDEIQSLRDFESQYVPPQLPLHKEDTSISSGQDEQKSNDNANESSDESDNDSNEEDNMTSLPPLIQPYQKLENLYSALRGIRQQLIYFEVVAIKANPVDDVILLGRISRLVTLLVLESGHRKNILPNIPSLHEPPEFQDTLNQALSIVSKQLSVSSYGKSPWVERESYGELRNAKEHSNANEIELENMNSDVAEPANIELSIVQLRDGYESITVSIPIMFFKADEEHQSSFEFFQKWAPPSSLIKVWTKRISSTLAGLNDSTMALSYAKHKINECEKEGRLARWADVARIKTRLIVRLALSKQGNFRSFPVAELSELKRAYFVNGLIEGIWSTFWFIILLFTLVIVFLQIISARSFLSLITVWNSKDKYAITAVLYESTNSKSVMITVYCIFMLPLIRGFVKGVKSMLTVTSDPSDEFCKLLRCLRNEVEGLEDSGWFLRAIWWDGIRWKLPWYSLKNQLGDLMDLARWDARISASDRYDALSILILLYQNRGGETRSVVSGYIAEFVDIMRPDGPNLGPDNRNDSDRFLPVKEIQISDDEAIIVRATKVKAIEFLLSMGEFPVAEWSHARWYAYPSLLWHYLEGRYRNWWIGLSYTIFEFAVFAIITVSLAAMSLLFVSTAVEAIREYAACPHMKGIAFTGPAPYVGKFDSECWMATMHEFGRIQGQPPETLTSTLPKFYFSKMVRRSFTLDISGKGLDGIQIGKLIDGFIDNGFTITKLLARKNSIGTVSLEKPLYLTPFSNSLEKLSSTLEVLDLSECSLGARPSKMVVDIGEWKRFYEVLGGLSALKSLNMADNDLGLFLTLLSESEERMSTLFLNGVSKLTGLEELDLSHNRLPMCDLWVRPYICLDIGNAIASLHSLKYLKLHSNSGSGGSDNFRFLLDAISNPNLTYLDLSNCLATTIDFKRSVLSLASRHPKLEHLNLSQTHFLFDLDSSRDEFAQKLGESIRLLAGSLKYLGLSYVGLDGQYSTENFAISALSSISTLEKLETLDLSDNEIGVYSKSGEVISTFSDMLSRLSSLRELNIGEYFGDFKVCNAVSEHIKLHPQLKTIPNLVLAEDIEEFVKIGVKEGRLSFRNTLIPGFAKYRKAQEETSDVFRRIFNAIAKHSDTITSLDLSGVGLSYSYPYELQLVSEGLEAISRSGKKLEELSLAGNEIAPCSDAATLSILKKGITAHRNSLKHLDLGGEQLLFLSVNFAKMLKELFLELGQLESLNLSNNYFGNDQLIYEYIGEGIVYLQSLKKLVLEEFDVGSPYMEGEMFFFDSISKLANLQELDVTKVDLMNNPKIWPSFSSIFSMPSLRVLRMKRSFRVFPHDELLNFLESMKQAKKLRILDITDNNLGFYPTVENKVIDTIKSFENLCSLSLSGNNFGSYTHSKGIGDLMLLLPRLIDYDLRGVAGADWTEHAASISEAIARDLRTKCESRVCRGSEAPIQPPICKI